MKELDTRVFERVDTSKFVRTRDFFLPKARPDVLPYITMYTVNDLNEFGAQCFLHNQFPVGFCLIGDEIVNLFNAAPGTGFGRFALYTAIRKGGHGLFCLGDFLRDWYTQAGFYVLVQESWDEELAPEDWPANLGTPNAYTMVHSGVIPGKFLNSLDDFIVGSQLF